MCVHPINSQSFEYLFSSGKYLYKSSLFISLISNVENPGVSAIYELLSNLYKYVFVVVFFPLLFLLLIIPSLVISFENILLINVDFPTPEFPEKAVILFLTILLALLFLHFVLQWF